MATRTPSSLPKTVVKRGDFDAQQKGPIVIEQAVILCGGLGTRLGALTAETPKPLLPVGGTAFLQILIQEIARSGIRKFLLLAGHLSEQIVAFAETVPAALGMNLAIDLLVERSPAGTGGALYEARDRLADVFVLLNGDSFLDCPLHLLGALLNDRPHAVGTIALRRVPDSGRYGSVKMADGGIITSFEEKNPDVGAGLINGGIYLLRRAVLDYLEANCSLERDIIPRLVEQGRLLGCVSQGFFIDIGLPETYQEAQDALLAHRHRPAVFLDRDGVLNNDMGHVGTVDRFFWTQGASAGIKLLNEKGYYVFVVTNQAGIAKGKYSLEQYWTLRDHIRQQLFFDNAQIDDERFCPCHPESVSDTFRHTSDWRKPSPGMLVDLMKRWPVDKANSFLIGDNLTDLIAAEAVGVASYQFTGGDFKAFVLDCLLRRSELQGSST